MDDRAAMKQFFFAQKAVVESGTAIVLLQKSDADPNQPRKWEIPGGRMRFGEEVDEHLVREVREEIGLTVLPGAPFYLWQWQLSRLDSYGAPIRMQVVAVARRCAVLSGDLSLSGNAPDDYIADCAWVEKSDVLAYDLIDNTRPVLEAYLRISDG